MSIFDDFDIIWDHSHYWNWSPDWLVVKEVYEKVYGIPLVYDGKNYTDVK